jgi:predicted GIY-YIG superfamily endonuclease
MHFVYILQSQQDQSYYTGTTENVDERLREHNGGSAKYSSTKKPYALVWYCTFQDKKKALAFERYLKQGSGFAFRNKHLL